MADQPSDTPAQGPQHSPSSPPESTVPTAADPGTFAREPLPGDPDRPSSTPPAGESVPPGAAANGDVAAPAGDAPTTGPNDAAEKAPDAAGPSPATSGPNDAAEKKDSAAAPPRTTADNDPRGRWTIRSHNITPELLTAVRKAAERAGMKQGDWIADRLFRVAVDELKRETLPGPTLEETAKILADIRSRLDEQRPDPRLNDIADRLEAIDQKIDRPGRAEARLGAMMDDMAELRTEVQRTRQRVEQQPRGFLSRLFGR